MREWKEYKLSDLCDLIGGGTPKTTNPEYWDGDIPWLSVNDFNNGKKYCFDTAKKITQKGLDESSSKILKKGQIIISARGTVGVISMLRKDMAFNQSSYGINAKKGFTTNDFLYYLLKDNIAGFHSASYGAVFDTITKETFNQIIISLPALTEQTAIAEVLSSLDDKIDLLHRQNKTLEQLAETLFKQMMSENNLDRLYDRQDEKIKKSCTSDNPENPVQDNVEGWSVRKLGEFIKIYDRKRIPVSSGERAKMKVGQLYPYYGAATIMDYINDYIFDGEYILMGEDGTVQTPDGYPILQLPTGKFWVNNHAHIFQAKAPFSNFFIYIFLKLTNISGIVTGAVQPKINQEALKNIDFPIPPLEKTKNLIYITNEFWGKIKSNTQQIRTLTQLRDTLLPKLMSGEIRLNRI